ncbi:MAG: tRNA (guanosine(46)-N7)-methyltransferase TrmB [Pseudomonadales bacterium]
MVLRGPEESVNWSRLFRREAPLGVEVGFGMGHALLEWADQRPDWNLIGVEIYEPGIGALLLGMEHAALGNVRVLAEDARFVFERRFQPASLQEVRAFFPDPWPKRRHHKRRLVQPEFVSSVVSRMRIGARLLLATDWQDYAESMLKVLDHNPQLDNIAGDGSFSARPENRSPTRFEDRGHRLGYPVWDLAYTRNC